MLTPSFLAEIRQRLEAQRVQLENDLKDLGSKRDTQQPEHFETTYRDTSPDTDTTESEDDIANEVTAYADTLSLVERLSKELRDTVNSINALDKGTYGICRYCKKEIDQKRLEARPTSSACIACKKLMTQEL